VRLGFSPGEARDKSVVKWSSAQARSRRCCRQIQASVLAPTSTHLIHCARLTLIGKSKLGETVVVAGGEWPGRLARRPASQDGGSEGGRHSRRRREMPYVAEEVRFNAAIDHRAPDFADRLAASCPDGGSKSILRNVGGAIWQAVMPLLKGFARVPVCGLIARSSRWPQPAGRDPARSAEDEPHVNRR
jgi:NADPH-dependent curcumin reductase CurA